MLKDTEKSENQLDKGELSPGERVAELVSQTAKPSELMLKDKRIRTLERQYKIASQEAADYKEQLDAVASFGDIETTYIAPSSKTGSNTEGTAILVASDWHVEEIVRPDEVNNLNEYNPDIAEARAHNFWRTGQRLIEVIGRDLDIKTVVLALLGDFITNSLHEDSAERNSMLPTKAAIFAQELLASGIKHILKNSDRKIVVVCSSGNHGRTTKRIHFGNEDGHSLEYMAYVNLANQFKDEPRITFNISGGYHTYLGIMGKEFRLHHGHSIKYQGGVGGITIPVNKAIAQWDKAHRADHDIFGHFHQYLDGGKFFANGSLIGYNAYALSIKAEYEPPKQGFLIVDEKRGRTYTAPIYVDE